MEISKGIEIIDLALFVKKQKILVLSDFHIGYEESLSEQGILVPRLHLKDIKKRLVKIIKKTSPSTIVVNGDLKHEFSRISKQEWRDSLNIIDYLEQNCKKLILIKGNHDKILEPIAEKRNLELADDLEIEDIVITHGHNIPKIKRSIKTIIIGHEHPAIRLKDNSRAETFKCFLKGKYKSKELIVMPSFNLVTEGSDILAEKTLSPFLDDISDFEVFIPSETKTLYFGKVKELKK